MSLIVNVPLPYSDEDRSHYKDLVNDMDAVGVSSRVWKNRPGEWYVEFYNVDSEHGKKLVEKYQPLLKHIYWE